MNIWQFAQAQGILAKTDKIDALVIAQFGAKMEPEIRLMNSKKVRHFRVGTLQSGQWNDGR